MECPMPVSGRDFHQEIWMLSILTSRLKLKSSTLAIQGVQFQDRLYDVHTSLTASEDELLLADLLLQEGSLVFPARFMYRGTDFVSLVQAGFLAPFEATFSLDADDERKISLSLLGERQRISGALQLSSLALDRFSKVLEGTVVDFSAVGYSDFQNQASVDGRLSLIRGDASFSSNLAFDQDVLRLYDSRLLMPDFSYTGQALTIQNATARSSGRLEHIRHLSYKDQFTADLNYP